MACLVAGVGLPVAGQPAPTAVAFEVLTDQVLLPALAWPRDIRWSGPDSVYLALAPGGVVELRIDSPAEPRFLVALPEMPSRATNAERLAASRDWLVVGSMAFAVRWKGHERAGFAGELSLEYVADLDLRQDRLLVVGIRRDKEGRLGGDGNLAWLGRLGEPFERFRPVLPSRSGPGVAAMEACAPLEVSAARFLADGSFLVVPGAEPGIFRYGPDGQLRRTWDSDLLGIGDPCDMPKEAGILLSADPEARARWLNRRRVVEDVLPLTSAPAVVVRERVGERTWWDAVLLHEDGSTETIRLPIASSSPRSRLRGDVRGERVALLVATWGAPPGEQLEHRLVIGRFVERAGTDR